jgi:hypothetical protein
VSICSVDNNLALKLQDARKFLSELPSFSRGRCKSRLNELWEISENSFLILNYYYADATRLVYYIIVDDAARLWMKQYWTSEVCVVEGAIQNIEGSNYFTIKPPTFSGEWAMLCVFPRVWVRISFHST